MRKITLALSAAALAMAGAAFAQPGAAPNGPGNAPQTRAEVEKHVDAMFAQMDANKDGKLDAKDREARGAEHFAKIDKDGNGQISRQEFADARPGPDGPPPPMDGKGPGKGMKGHGKKGHPGMAFGGPGPMMDPQAADTNKDGAISKDEFRAAALARFDKIDTDHDGTISKAERKSAKQAHKAERKAEGRAKRQAPDGKSAR
ncbi:hypothetical protein SZ64_14835 [Erythrobacter sp. SG61-1L]|uniref:EF-hand domain-containing protein n=1 Tax=Erythrobacter sp. SG61-1L TaxID=1603897 RepID=UPI0006C8E61F|nr:EF-hand domain-containing protein [Erythrobacter sp. SG61-1L]KPL69267.1 hypothetical protein SZ64_14835 [Erythrobacter sp. SG61-1L]